MINLEWYRSFLAVYRAGTVSRAAEALFLTQPAVTQHLAALEKQVGESLFIRAPRQMIPTTRGKQLYSQIVQAMETLEQVSQELQSTQVELPLLRCGAPREYFGELLLQTFVALPYRLIFQFDETRPLIEALERGQLDIVIATQQVAAYAVEYHRIGEEHFCVVGPPQLEPPEVIEREAIEQWLSAQKWISYGVELPIIRRYWQQCFGKRPTFQATLVLPDLHLIVRAISEGGGISVLPDYLCRALFKAGQLRLLWEPGEPVRNELWLAYRKIDRNERIIKQCRQLLQQRGGRRGSDADTISWNGAPEADAV
uniref:LysR family transcriptional regulator n=1 Tax=Thermosporothrix sp. COM3 TaxID=2490863 RepID=A0A455SJG4_9CHLR|nr:LysR family transcriptional regulator [Thermosporothrix sp. COM3]